MVGKQMSRREQVRLQLQALVVVLVIIGAVWLYFAANH
jgi:hypothetical protein